MQPYTYLLTDKITGRKYYGSRYSKDCNPSDLLVSYFTSSKEIKKMLYDSPTRFISEIRRTFDDQISARKWESKVLRRIKAAQRPDFINLHNGGDKFYTISVSDETKEKLSNLNSGKGNPFFGKKHKPNTKAILSRKLKGRTWTAEQREVRSKLMKGKRPSAACLIASANSKRGVPKTEEQKQKLRAASLKHIELNGASRTGKTHSRTAREKIGKAVKGKMWFTDGKTNLFLRSTEGAPEGFVRGRTLSVVPDFTLSAGSLGDVF